MLSDVIGFCYRKRRIFKKPLSFAVLSVRTITTALGGWCIDGAIPGIMKLRYTIEKFDPRKQNFLQYFYFIFRVHRFPPTVVFLVQDAQKYTLQWFCQWLSRYFFGEEGEVAWQFFVFPGYSNAQCSYLRSHQKQTKVAHVPFAVGCIRVLKKQMTANISCRYKCRDNRPIYVIIYTNLDSIRIKFGTKHGNFEMVFYFRGLDSNSLD